MKATRAKMICPECGVEMNHHADKLIYATHPDEEAHMDAALGGLIQETHTCPGCGSAAARLAN